LAENYAYKARDRAGKMVTGTLYADNDQVVIARLREMGYIPVKVEKKREGLQREISLRPGRVKQKELAVFSRQFATMVNSGLPILRALTILAQQTESKNLSKVLTDVRMDVERGSSLSAAMSKHPKAFNNLYTSMVRAGETGGVLDSVLMRLADNLEKEVRLVQTVKSAMTYPAVVLVMVSLVLVAMLTLIVPQFEGIYETLGGTLPLPTRILLGVSTTMRKFWFMWAAVIAGAIFLFRRYKRTDNGREQVDRIKLRLPLLGPLFRKTALSRFSNTLSVLLRSGVPILQSLDIVAQTVNNRIISKAIHDVQKSVKEGESIARPLGRHPVFPPMVVQMLAVGEETGSVDVMLSKVAEFYDNEVKAAVDAMTSLIEPILIAVIGSAVGAAVIALYMPMFNIIKILK
jgi:type IV pilus assembly protein PilC